MIHVESDGNCGFRTLAVARTGYENEWRTIRLELLNHLRARSPLFLHLWGKDQFIRRSATLDFFHTPPPRQNWFSAPDMAVVAADLYQRPVVVLGGTLPGCVTCLPYRAEGFTPSPIVMVHVNDNHFNMGVMNHFRLPLLDPVWLSHLEDFPDLLPIYEMLRERVSAWAHFINWAEQNL